MKVSIRKYAEALSESLKGEKDSAMAKGKIENFLLLLQKRKKTKMLKRFPEVFTKIWHEKNGKISVKVVLPEDPTEKDLDSLAKYLDEMLGKKAVLEVVVDPKIIGGMKLLMDDSVIDGTVKKNLEMLKIKLVNS